MSTTTTLSSLLSNLKPPSILTSSWTTTLLFLFLAANIKSLPFVWHLRFLRTLIARLLSPSPNPKRSPPLSPSHLFLPSITTTLSPTLECDYNIHKSNSTYFSDLDISRTNLLLLLFRPRITDLNYALSNDNGVNDKSKLVPMLGGVQCSFRREIRPYQGYEMWTRVLSWDEKWVYLVSHFVEKGKVKPGRYVLQGGGGSGGKGGRMEQKYVLASSVARYVFKSGRKTVPPQEPLVDCNLLPLPLALESEDSDDCGDKTKANETYQAIEKQRKKNLEIAQLKRGWDSIHELFSSDDGGDDEEEVLALGRYTDFLWR